MDRSNTVTCGAILGIFLVVCCVVVVVMGGLGLVVFRNLPPQLSSIPLVLGDTTPTPVVIRPTAIIEMPTPTQEEPNATQAATEPAPVGTEPAQVEVPTQVNPPSKSSPALAVVPTDTLKTLETSDVPISNLIDLAARLKGIENIPVTLTPPPVPFQTGDRQDFWITNLDTNNTSKVSATLQYITPHLYFWVENGFSYNSSDLQKLSNTFEDKIYPTDREFFGSEWTPGVDDDVHLYILFTRGLGSSLAGYYSSADEYSPLAHKYSNGHEMFMLNADNLNLGDPFTYGVLAHEFQHMIHWYRDRNETSWMNEGFSELAMSLNGYDVGGFDTLYTMNPDVQLNDWPNDAKATGPHYGASFLYLTYFLDRFHENATKAVVADTENGLESIDNVLKQIGAKDPKTGQQVTADSVFEDWVVASYLQDANAGDGRYTYHNYPNAPKPRETERVRNCPVNQQTRDVHQYGVDYIRITCPGDYTLHFEGSTQVGVLPEGAHSGKYAFWSNKGDESDMTLTQSFDFSNHTGPLTFSYWTWYDTEKDYDYVYVEASSDGKNWTILKTPSGTSKDLSGNSYGWGYNGDSGGGNTAQWIQEKVDLSPFDGKKVLLRFEYVTDAAVNGEGFLVDDISIPEMNYSTDFESNTGGWDPKGFVRIDNSLPQTYGISLITRGSNTSVQAIPLSSNVSADIPIHIGGDVNEVVLVISGTTRFTRQTAAYRFSITPK